MARGGGRPPKPTALKILQGNPGKRPLPKHEPKPKGQAVCPDWLPDRARAIWDRHAAKLAADGLLTERDEDAFARFCVACAEWEGFTRAKFGLKATNTTKLAYLCRRADAAAAMANRLGQKFGMTPSDRVGLSLPTKPQQPKDEEFLFGRRDQA